MGEKVNRRIADSPIRRLASSSPEVIAKYGRVCSPRNVLIGPGEVLAKKG